MKVEFALKEVLDQFGMRKQGLFKELAEHLNIGPQHLSALTNNHPKIKSIQYGHVAQICSWLLNNVPEKNRQHLRSQLPGVLFRFVGLWDVLLQKPTVMIYLCERMREEVSSGSNTPANTPSNAPNQVSAPASASASASAVIINWISGADAAVATNLVQRLTRDGASFALHWKNLPRHISDDQWLTSTASMQEDQRVAKTMYAESKQQNDALMLLVGSQRVNFMVEALVADMAGCDPFVFDESSSLPIYLQYRSQDSLELVSCFAGHGPPPGFEGDGSPGIYYRQDTRWVHLPIVDDKRDAGVVIVFDDTVDDRSVQYVALFGFTVAGTQAIGDYFGEHPEQFSVSPSEVLSQRSYGIFCCQLEVNSDALKDSPGNASSMRVVERSLVSLQLLT